MLQALSRFPMLLLPAVLLAGPAFANEESGGPTIITQSPFLPPDFNPPGSGAGDPSMPASASQYEFRGVYQMGGQYYFNLYNTRDKSGTWVTEKESGGDSPRIVRFDLDEDILVVEVSGERVNLELVETSDRPMPVANAPRRAPATRPAQAPTTRTTEARPTTTPVRRRVIRPSTRNPTSSTAARRPTIPSSNNQQQQP
ncbi:MAG: hypothetical protein AB3N33_04040 [Puniceicoccaceae bacterium]